MEERIRVYLKSEEIECEISGKLAVQGHPCYGYKKEVIVKLPEAHKRAKKIAEEVAKEEGLEIEIYDLSNSFKNRLLAFFRSIKTPSIEIGNKRVNGVPSKEELLSLLGH
ncbi:hypothetical protein GWN63_01655 [Candidatus Bathyarchaeota archaeon]|nr:hypothetical protein [Candidatus Bathyarchaeota archaeon]NIU80941.1 hypothetical protein [Candidatus Bathyarchaeota archaeon]NIV67597.1 hypothetical protein [Candidatus Bathyarchaeota archaeon]NIW16120.1 hypothetical protein [Candidatus Bathyarchaeota archaeon]NIW34226.1 hypothetical protein [Candidatus Bathyarchaeota archaeon]